MHDPAARRATPAASREAKMKTLIRTLVSHRLTKLLPVAALAALAGCAHVANPTPQDPWESYNRSMFKFNDTVDRAVLKPVAQGYETVVPRPARTCIGNIFNNMGDIWSAFNSFLQGRAPDGINSFGRVLLNTTMGLGGCFDLASMNGVQRIENDFGVTLGVWGIKSGPYLVLPFLGPSSLRDGVSTALWYAVDTSPSYAPVFQIDNIPLRNSILALAVVDLRAKLLPTDAMVNRIALDRYSFIRDAYVQRRKALVRGRHLTPHSTPDTVPNYDDDSLPNYEDEPSDAGTSAPAAQPANKAPAGQ